MHHTPCQLSSRKGTSSQSTDDVAPLQSGSQASQYEKDTSFYARRNLSPKLIHSGTSYSSSSVSKNKKRYTQPGRRQNSSTHTALVKAVRMNYSPTRNVETDPFDRDFQEQSSSLYICPEAPYHSNEYLMNSNAHKYTFDATDLYKQLDHSGSMMGPYMTRTDPFLTIHSLEQENLSLRNRIEALEARIVQLETVAAT